MNIIHVVNNILAEHQAYYVRHTNTEKDGTINYAISMRNPSTRIETDWILIDVQTANVIRAAHQALKPENQERFLKMDLELLISFCWSRVK